PYLELNNTRAEAPKSISTTTGNAIPAVITATAHGYSDGDEVVVSGATGNTAADGRWIVASSMTNTFAIIDFAGDDVVGNGTYVSGGTVSRWAWFSYSSLSAKTTARYSRLRIYNGDAGAFRVNSLGNIRVQVTAKHEGGFVTTSASAPATVSFIGTYNKAVSASALPVFDGTSTPDGSRCVVDMIEVSGGRGINALYLLRFNGTSDYVAVGDFATYEFGGGADSPFSIECWIKLASVGAAQVLVSKGNQSGALGSYELRVGAAGKVQFIVIDQTAGAFVNCASSTLLVADLWYHVACTYSGANAATPGNLKIYING